CTERRSVNGGITTTSTSAKPCFASASSHASYCSTWTAWWWSRFIFQLPAMSGVRLCAMSPFRRLSCRSALEHGDPGELLALQELQARAATGRDVAELRLVEAETAHRGGRVATAHDREAVRVGHRLGDGPRTTRERLELEDAHRAVPHDRARRADRLGESLARGGADVEADPVRGERVGRDDLVPSGGREGLRG